MTAQSYDDLDLQKLVRLDTLICFAVYSAEHAFSRFYRPILSKLGLTYPQFLVMMVLWETSGVPMRTLCQRLQLESSTLTPLLKKLETAGLIDRTRSRQDERVMDIKPTEKGMSLHRAGCEAAAIIAGSVGETLENLEKLRAQLTNMRDTLNNAADKAENAA